MIEVIYSGETNQPNAQTEATKTAWKNIRQIGRADGTLRIYIEDTVMSFLARQMKKETLTVAALFGREVSEGEQTQLHICGAILPKHIRARGESLEIGAQAFPELYKQAETYFPETLLLGWYLPAYEMIGKYAATLGQGVRLFLLEDPTESQELFYLWEQGRLTKQNGYYIYYQRNEAMKDYMREEREAAAKADEDTKADDAIRSEWRAGRNSARREERDAKTDGLLRAEWTRRQETRTQEETRLTEQEAKKTVKRQSGWKPTQEESHSMEEAAQGLRLTPFLYGVSTVLAIVVLVIGITLINNYEKMYEMQEAIETLASTIKNGSAAAQPLDENGAALPFGEQTSDPDAEGNSTQSDGASSGASDDSAVNTTGAKKDSDTKSGVNAGMTFGNLPAGGEYYVIQQGDTLASISRARYQVTDEQQIRQQIAKIKALNAGLDENALMVGEKILLP